MNETVLMVFYPLNCAKSARKNTATGITISATSREHSLLFVKYYKEMYWIISFVNMLVGILRLLEYLDEKLCQNTLQYLQKL